MSCYLANNSGEWNRKVLRALQTFLCLQGASAGLFSRCLPNFMTFRDDSPTSHASPVLVLHLPLLVESFWWCLTQFLSPLQQSLICLKVVAVFALHLGFFRLNKPNSHSLQLCQISDLSPVLFPTSQWIPEDLCTSGKPCRDAQDGEVVPTAS